MSSAIRKLIAGFLVLHLLGWQEAVGQRIPIQIPKPPVPIPAPDLTTPVASILNNELPIKLDAKSAYTTTNILPGSSFAPTALEITVETLVTPLPPGDYTVPVVAFCTEYSVHRPGQGVAYELAPLQGKAAEAMATMIWRGMLSGRDPKELQAVAWGIQSGLTYAQMPKSFQATVDSLIPDYKDRLNGNFVQHVESTYQSYARVNPKAPPLDTLLGKMGKPGSLMLSAKRQQQILLQQNSSDQLRTQTLFAGQESGVYSPQRAEEGPWTVVNSGAAYIRFKVVGGNMAANNMLEIRIPPQERKALLLRPFGARMVEVSQGPGVAAITEGPSLLSMLGVRITPQLAATLARVGVGAAGAAGTLGPDEVLLGLIAVGVIGYAIGQGAQALILTMARPSKKSGKEKSTDRPSWVDKYLPMPPNEDCDAFATRILNDKYGAGNWKTGPGSEYSKIKKACERGGL